MAIWAAMPTKAACRTFRAWDLLPLLLRKLEKRAQAALTNLAYQLNDEQRTWIARLARRNPRRRRDDRQIGSDGYAQKNPGSHSNRAHGHPSGNSMIRRNWSGYEARQFDQAYRRIGRSWRQPTQHPTN
ncbi:MAG: hypothetical protein R2856_15540 [Caldilineaceae bacterium]